MLERKSSMCRKDELGETYRIPPGTGPGPLPNRQRFGIDLLDLFALRDREERMDDRTEGPHESYSCLTGSGPHDRA